GDSLPATAGAREARAQWPSGSLHATDPCALDSACPRHHVPPCSVTTNVTVKVPCRRQAKQYHLPPCSVFEAMGPQARIAADAAPQFGQTGMVIFGALIGR